MANVNRLTRLKVKCTNGYFAYVCVVWLLCVVCVVWSLRVLNCMLSFKL